MPQFKNALAIVAAMALTSTPLLAQRQVLDRVVAVVGDSVILLSEIDEQINQMVAAGQPQPKDSAERASVQRALLSQKVDNLLLVQAALRAKIEVSEDGIRRQVDADLADVRKQFPTQLAMEQAMTAAGMTLSQWRDMVGAKKRGDMLTNTYLSRTVSGALPTVTDVELHHAYDASGIADSIRPAAISFRQIVINPSASDSARATALKKIQAAEAELDKGTPFADVAKKYSDDPGSRNNGGDLGWSRRGDHYADFDDVVFDGLQRPGQVSGIVTSPLGFHIIKLDNMRGAERHSFHILSMPTITDNDIERARLRSDSVVVMLKAGHSPDSISTVYHDKDEPAAQEDVMLSALATSYPAPFAENLSSAKTGDVVGPFKVTSPQGRTKYVVAIVTNTKPAGKMTFDDVKDELRTAVARQKAYDQLIKDLHTRFNIETRLN